MNDENFKVLTNIIGAVESGGQIYGRRNYAAYTGPRKAIPGEKTITLGWAQNYGYEAKRLIKLILEKDPEEFRKLDTCEPSVERMLGVDWVATCWIPDEETRDVLIALIDSESGHAAQDELFISLMETFVADCIELYTDDIRAIMMYCEIRHVGGKGPAGRIFNRCGGDYSLNNIMGALAKDQLDKTNDNQVGDLIYWSRHVKCKEFIETYAVEEAAPVEEVKELTAKERAKILLRQQNLKVMTGFTPEGAQCFKDAGAWSKVPAVGYPVYFYGKPSGESYRICHVGVVEWVNPESITFGTVEGNTSSTTWSTNGGVVARHTYSYKNVGGTNRVNGFGIPDFEGAGVTPEAFVAVAVSYIGYEEKRSNDYLDDFHANAGSGNYQKFERDVIGYTGDQWCQYFVDAIALYVCEGEAVEVTGGYDLKVRELSKGSAGSDVKTVQILLIHKFGISCGAAGADGDFGDDTDYAVRKFQTIKGLEVDGAVGPLTWAALVA